LCASHHGDPRYQRGGNPSKRQANLCGHGVLSKQRAAHFRAFFHDSRQRLRKKWRASLKLRCMLFFHATYS
jgi:hypothetical protein